MIWNVAVEAVRDGDSRQYGIWAEEHPFSC